MGSDATEPGLPRRCIFDESDMEAFRASPTRAELLRFAEALGAACASPPSDPLAGLPPAMACLHGALEEAAGWVDEIPPLAAPPGGLRFGNPSFRGWHGRLEERSGAILGAILRTGDRPSAEEARARGRDAAAGRPVKGGGGGKHRDETDLLVRQVKPYLLGSFGHPVRLDYGTGHESSFLVLLLVLSKAGCLGSQAAAEATEAATEAEAATESATTEATTSNSTTNTNSTTTTNNNTSSPRRTLRAVALSLFDQYLRVTRRLQTEYRLEPAGSHGVWGLDDYHCLPFYLGACQLVGACGASVAPRELHLPSCINDGPVLREHGDAYLYLGCIRYVQRLKAGVPFFESSPMLYDVSQSMPSWDRVAKGLLRLYKGEVLDKRVVVQHFVFSGLFPCTWTPSRSGEEAPPTETFRGGLPQGAPPGGVVPTRAPWAGPR